MKGQAKLKAERPKPVPPPTPKPRRPKATLRIGPPTERAPPPLVEVSGRAHKISSMNPAFCQLVGKSRAQLIGRPFAEIVPNGAKCLPALNRVYRTGEAATHSHEVETETNRAHWFFAICPPSATKGHPIPVIIKLTKSGHFWRHAAAINGALLISGLHQHELSAEAVKLNALLEKEIAERKSIEVALRTANQQLARQAGELEELVAQRTETLRETVADLEGFSYSVAHDMRTPLRGMQGFARILLDSYGDSLDADAKNYLGRIASSAARMDLLIQDVLNFTRVMRSEALLSPIDLDALVKDLLSLYPDWQAPKAIIEISGTLPRVLGHEGFLTQCVSNLLSNAVKFVAPGVTPRVRIWAEERLRTDTGAAAAAAATTVNGSGSVVRVWFEDNGIGIAERDRSRIFRLFERINSADQFEGTGVGLTIVRKAIQRLNGRVDFESELGRGSKFWIELAQAPAAAAADPPPL
jgi:signal transduction histidine kinase